MMRETWTIPYYADCYGCRVGRGFSDRVEWSGYALSAPERVLLAELFALVSSKRLVGGTWSSCWLDAKWSNDGHSKLMMIAENVPGSDTHCVASAVWRRGDPLGISLRKMLLSMGAEVKG